MLYDVVYFELGDARAGECLTERLKELGPDWAMLEGVIIINSTALLPCHGRLVCKDVVDGPMWL